MKLILSDSFQRADGIPDGSNAASIMPTGHAWSVSLSGNPGSAVPQIVSKTLTLVQSAPGGSTDVNVDIGFVPGVMVFTFTLSDPFIAEDGQGSSEFPWWAPITSSVDTSFSTYSHPLFYRDKMIYRHQWHSITDNTQYISTSYPSLMTSGVTYTATVEYNGNRVTLTSPFGQKVSYSDQNVGRCHGRYINVQMNRNGTTSTGTYSQTTNVITITKNGHGKLAGDVITAKFTSGGALDAQFTIQTASTNTFTVTALDSGTKSGNCTLCLNPSGSVNFNSMVFYPQNRFSV
jgi:hypothetical protein